MARSVQDATRFTYNGLNAATASRGSRSTILNFADPAPANETPQQKIARLKAASRRAKLAQETTFDKIVIRGRAFADRAHRVTVYSLITISGMFNKSDCSYFR
jgi:hypothetical protein